MRVQEGVTGEFWLQRHKLVWRGGSSLRFASVSKSSCSWIKGGQRVGNGQATDDVTGCFLIVAYSGLWFKSSRHG